MQVTLEQLTFSKNSWMVEIDRWNEILRFDAEQQEFSREFLRSGPN